MTNSETPALFNDLAVADRLRFGLVSLIAALLSTQISTIGEHRNFTNYPRSTGFSLR
jgi:hypothetical protein